MPIALAVRIVVMTNWGVIFLEIRSWSQGSLNINFMKSGKDRCAGLVHRVIAKKERRPACAPNSDNEKFFDRKISSFTNLQLTVHLYKNCRVNWNALDMYEDV